MTGGGTHLPVLGKSPIMNFSPQLNRKVHKEPQSGQPNRLSNVSNSTTKSRPIPRKHFSSPRQASPIIKSAVPSPITEQSSPSPPPIAEPSKPDPVIKCNTCGQFVKQSVFKSHKLYHPQTEKVMNTLKDEDAKQSVTESESKS